MSFQPYGSYGPPHRQPQTPGISAADASTLDTLAVLFWAYGVLVILLALFVFLMGCLPAIIFAFAPTPAHGSGGPPPALAMGFMVGMFGIVALFFIGKAIVVILAGVALKRRRNYVLCMVAACLAVLNMPLGTMLAVFAFVTLNKPGVKAAFDAAA